MQSGLVLGVITGLSYGLLAVGIVLVYKANRFVNIAHAQVGAVGAVILGRLVLNHGWSWWSALPLVAALGIGISMLVQRYVVRPLVDRGRGGTSLLLVSLGVAQILLAATYLEMLRPDESALYTRGFPTPFHATWDVGSVVLRSHHLMTLVVVPVAIGILAVFLRASVWGKAIRACASNPEAASLCGIPARRVGALAWGIAGLLSTVTALLQAPDQGGFEAAALGPRLLLVALGAAAAGGFTSVSAAMIGGLVLGIVENVTLAVRHDGGDAQLMVFVSVLVIVLVRGRAINAAADETAAVTEDAAPAPVPENIAERLVVRRQRVLLWAAAIFVGVIAPQLPMFDAEADRFQLVITLTIASVGVSLTMLLGWAGQVSLGHAAVMGVGAYCAAKLGESDVPLIPTMIAAGLAGAGLMTLVGLPAIRVRGLALAVTTLGFAVIAPTWLFRQPWLSADGVATTIVPPLGIPGIGRITSQLDVYYAALVLLVLVVACAGALRRSNAGRLVVAVRDDERGVSSLGITPGAVKLGILATSGFFAGAAGVLWGSGWRTLSVDILQPDQSLALLAVPVIGGIGSAAGAVGAAVALYVPVLFLTPLLESIFGRFASHIGFHLAFGGLGLVVMPIQYPAGLAGIARHRWHHFLDGVARSVRGAPAEPTEPLVVRDLWKRFGGIEALTGASIEVHPGEIVGLIGPNGAGKTTLMNAVSGIFRCDDGTMHVFGRDVSELPPEYRAHLGLGRNFQDARLYPGLTTRETLQLALASRARNGVLSSMVGAPWARFAERRSRERADEIIERLGMTQWADTLTSDLSTGMRRICSLAVQVAAEPRVLMLDEPTAGVAQRDAEAFGPLLLRIRDELACSILIVEHDMPLLMSVCDRVYAMERGRVIAEGTPEEIRRHPDVIASYLGTRDVAIHRSGRGAVAV